MSVSASGRLAREVRTSCKAAFAFAVGTGGAEVATGFFAIDWTPCALAVGLSAGAIMRSTVRKVQMYFQVNWIDSSLFTYRILSAKFCVSSHNTRKKPSIVFISLSVLPRPEFDLSLIHIS